MKDKSADDTAARRSVTSPDDGATDDPRRQESLPLLDAATPDVQSLRDVEALRLEAPGSDTSLEGRVEAFEDVIDAQVGDTTLLRARNTEREAELRQIYLKFEGSNPTGTQKDRIAFAQALDALRRGFDGVSVATCGNYGAAMALAASLARLRCIIYVPQAYHTRRLEEMTLHGAEIVRSGGDYENAVRLSRERAERDELYDANPGGANTAMQIQAYAQIAHEIYDELRDAPAAVCVPVSNGTTLAGIYRGFVSLYRRGKTSHVPRMVAGSSTRKNPVVRSYLKNSAECVDLDPARVRETSINEPLINWHSYDGDHALAALRESGGWACDTSDREMLEHARLLRSREGLHVLPASTSGLVALLGRHRQEPLPGDRYVVILTGRRE